MWKFPWFAATGCPALSCSPTGVRQPTPASSFAAGVPRPRIFRRRRISMIGPSMMDNIKSIRCSGVKRRPFCRRGGNGRIRQVFFEAGSPGALVLRRPREGICGLSARKPPGFRRHQAATMGPDRGRPDGRHASRARTRPLALSTLAMSQRPPELRVMLHTETDSEGRFEFASVPPGEYRISHRPAAGSGGQFRGCESYDPERLPPSESAAPAGPSPAESS